MSLETIWYGAIALVCMCALIDWRRTIYLGIVLDVLRDPVRKLVVNQPVSITLSGAAVWCVIVLVAGALERKQLRTMFRNYPGLQTGFYFVLLAILSAAAVSTIRYPQGWLLATVGAASYLVPVMGVLAGYGFLRSEADAARLIRWYILVNLVMLVSVPLEYLKVDVPALGGINFHWIRNRTGYTVNLMCGWYRSPDIMGLHAAHVIVFSFLLALRSGVGSRIKWLLPALVAGLCLLLSGRRKMVGIPFVFLATYVLVGMLVGMRRVGRLAGFSIAAALLGVALTVVFWNPKDLGEYTDFAGSLYSEGLGRSNEVIVGSTKETIHRNGWFGAGLGTATQGRRYLNVQTTATGWQEDGVSRLFLEFGMAGVILLLGSALYMMTSLRRSLRLTLPQSKEQVMQVGLVGVLAGDAASFAISHQQFSGDPVSALFVTMIAGMVFALPKGTPRIRAGQPLPTQVQPTEIAAKGDAA